MNKSRFINYNTQIFSALNQSLARTVIESDEIEMDTIDTGAEDPSKLEAARKEAEKTKNLQTLFKGTKNSMPLLVWLSFAELRGE